MSPGTISSMGISVPVPSRPVAPSRPDSPARTTQQVVVTMSFRVAAALSLLDSWEKRSAPEMSTMMPMMTAVEGSASPGAARITLV